MSLNQQDLYSAKDAVSASWLHESGITGSGVGILVPMREDIVEIYGSTGKITFSVFENVPLLLTTMKAKLNLL
jgi:hypothetical protein